MVPSGFGGLFRSVVCLCVCQRCGSCFLEFFLEFSPPGVCGLCSGVVLLGFLACRRACLLEFLFQAASLFRSGEDRILMLLGVVSSGGACGLGLVDAGLDFAACCAEFLLELVPSRFGGLGRGVVCFCVRPRCGSCFLEFFLEFPPSRLGSRDRLASSLGIRLGRCPDLGQRGVRPDLCVEQSLLEFLDAAFEFGDGSLMRGLLMFSGALCLCANGLGRISRRRECLLDRSSAGLGLCDGLAVGGSACRCIGGSRGLDGVKLILCRPQCFLELVLDGLCR